MSMDDLVDIINDSGQVVGSATKQETIAQSLLHNIAGVIVYNTQGEILIHRRAKTKEIEPEAWDYVSGGWLLRGEDPESAAQRELYEEFKIEATELELVTTIRHNYDSNNAVNFVYKTVIATPESMTVDHKEVAEYTWVKPEDLVQEMKEKNFTSWSQKMYQNHKSELFGRNE